MARKAPADHRDTLAGITLSTQGMAAHLGITTRFLQMKVKDGTLPSLGRGRFDPGATAAAYIDFVRLGAERKTGSDSLDKVREERALDLRISRERKTGQLITLNEAIAVVDDMTGIYLSSLTGLPARITGVPRERQRLNGIFDTERQRLADRFAKKRTALLEGRADADPEAEDDAA